MITGIRNFLFDRGILKSYTFNVPIIAVGNLSVGGTGKTPQIEYLIRLLSENFSVATLSRYKRKSEGFYWLMLLQMKYLATNRFSLYEVQNIQVAVDADRKNGIQQLPQTQKPEVILLDDAYQHRKVKAGFIFYSLLMESCILMILCYPLGT
jgi:tetraacyldisaccharide 4'-kinase